MYFSCSGSDTTWKVEYTYRSAYGLSDIKPVSLQQLLSKLKEDNSEEFEKYVKYNSVSLKPEDSDDGVCDCQCKTKHLCAIEFIDKTPYTECMDENYPVTCKVVVFKMKFFVIIFLLLVIYL